MKTQGIICGLSLVAFFGSAMAADVSPQDEYEKRLKLARTIEPLGEKPFGETLNMLTGELGFQVADIFLEGNGPDIVLTRTARTGPYERGNDPPVLGNWDLSLPRIETMVAATSRSGVGGSAGLNWKISDDNYARCTQFDWLGSDVWWAGYEFVSGTGERNPLLKRAPGNTHAPQMVLNGARMQFPAVIKGNWQVGCLPKTSNGEVG